MFSVKESEANASYTWAEWVVRIAFLLVFLTDLGSAYLIYDEYRWLSRALDNPDAQSAEGLAALRQEVAVQLVVSLAVSLSLAGCMAAIWWLRRRYLLSQRSLRQVKMLAHDILASMDRGVITTDRDLIVTSINSAASRLLAVDLDCVGRSLASISRQDVPLADVARDVVGSQGPVRDLDFRIERTSGAVRLRVDGHVLKDTQGISCGCVLHLRDVTQRTILEARMRRMAKFLSLSALASGLHHEIKNPLTALSIHIQLLEESLANGSAGEAAAEFVGVLKTEVARLNGVLDSFHNFTNLQQLTVQPTDPLEVLENTIKLIRPQAAEQGVAITLRRPDAALPLVPLNPEKFEQAVLNLIINALEAMPEGGQLLIRVAAADGELRVAIQDTGPGIPAEIQANLFQPYFSTKDKGSGLGLALSEKLINLHGGHIGYRTGPEGTTFDIAIPLQPRR